MSNYTSVEDSGSHTLFDTGSRRDLRTGKGRYDLISPIALHRLAKHYENGADKYGVRNWENGIPLHSYFDSVVRHLYAWLLCKLINKKQSEDHLSAAIWNIMCIIHTEELIEIEKLPKDLDDITKGILNAN